MTMNQRFQLRISLVLLVLGGLMAVVYFGPRENLSVITRRPEDRNVLRVAYTQLLLPDPHWPNAPAPTQEQFILSLWEPLVAYDPATSRPLPAAARSWVWSPDRLTLTLTLRPDARWSNGDPVKAEDFVRAWLQLLRQKGRVSDTLFALRNSVPYSRGTLKEPNAVGVHALDDFTLRVELDHQRASFVVELADPCLSPLHVTSEKVIGDHAYFGRPSALITNGPFRLVQANYDGFRLETSRFYHERSDVRLAGIQFVRVANPGVASYLAAAGIVDLISPRPYGPLKKNLTAREISLENETGLGVTAIYFNVTRGALQDFRVRRALALALDRTEANARFSDAEMTPAWSWVPNIPGREALCLLEEDTGEARRLLASAGYPAGKGFPILRMSLPRSRRDDPFPKAWTERWFQELGVRTYITYEPQVAWAQRLKTGDFDATYGTVFATVPDAGDLLSVFQQSADTSLSKWSDQRVVALLKTADRAVGEDRRAALEKAERLAMSGLEAVPVLFDQWQTLFASDVQGWYADPLGRQLLKRLWLNADPVTGSPVPKL
jgi:oligopeptide transport system substrate-binding protein